ncbi:MAG: endospore germination permease [Clostridia bacterium]|nr:endospore germination permease [Clostridia bacterium]
MEKGKITARQAMLLIIVAILGDGIFFLPTFVAAQAKTDAWLSFLLGSILGLLLTGIIIKLGLRFPDKTVIQYSEELAGTVVGKLLGIWYIAFFLVTTSYLTREFGEFLTTVVMPETPILIFMIFLSIAYSYAVYGGIEVMGRVAEFLTPIYIFLLIVMMGLSVKDMNLQELTPVMGNGIGPVIKGSIPPFAWTANVSAMLMLIPFINQPEQSKKASYMAVGVVGLLFVVNTMQAIAVLGAQEVARLEFPFFHLAATVRVANFLERIDALIMIVWVTGDFIRACVFYYVGLLGLSQWLKLKDYKPLVLPMSLLLVSLGIVQFDSIMEIHTWGGQGYPFYALSVEAGIPILLLIIAWVRGKSSRV